MKRLIAAALCLLLAAPAARAETVTLARLKEQTPERMEMSVTTDEGETVIVDAPITLPDGDTMPVVVVVRATFDTTDLRKAYPLPKGLDAIAIAATTADDHAGAFLLNLYQEAKSNRISGKVDSTGRAYLPQGSTPPDNDATPEDILAFLQENLQRFQCDTQPDIRVVKATAESGLYRMKRIKTPEGWSEYAVDESKPVANAGKGLWHLELAQYLYGARIFDDYFPYGCYESPANPNDWSSPIFFHADYLDEENFNLIAAPARPIGLWQEDAELLSYADVVQIVERRIREGKLKSVYALTLGYSVRIAAGDAYWADETYFDLSADTRFVLVPEWQILGFDQKDQAAAASVGLAEPTEQMVLEPEVYSRYGIGYELRMDACTGAFILDYAAQEFDLGDWQP